jgi:outer membrane protein TolC
MAATLLGLALLAAARVSAQPVGVPRPALDLGQDSVLAGLGREALLTRPELAQARASAKAELERAPQVAALPDPVFTAGLQNDGFDGLQIGKMETSWWSFGAAQTLPWFGTRGLRGTAQRLAARQSESDVERARLSIQAEIERAYVDLLLARDQLGLLDRLEALWAQAEGQSRARYETGQGAQTDLLRAQLERSRLKQRRAALIGEERRRMAVLGHALGRHLVRPLPPDHSLVDFRDPALPDSEAAETFYEARSPELRKAKLGAEQAATLVSLAGRARFPDVTVSGGIMPRGGTFDPMWQAGVSVPLPLWAGSKQSRAVGESRLRGEAARQNEETIRHMMRQRIEERRALLTSLLETNRLYRSGVLVQSEAAVASAMAQYQVGRVPFASVLEALSGYLSDLSGYYESLAATQLVDIAHREMSLEPVPGPGNSGIGGGPMPGTSEVSGGRAPAANSGTQPATRSTGMSGM